MNHAGVMTVSTVSWSQLHLQFVSRMVQHFLLLLSSCRRLCRIKSESHIVEFLFHAVQESWS